MDDLLEVVQDTVKGGRQQGDRLPPGNHQFEGIYGAGQETVVEDEGGREEGTVGHETVEDDKSVRLLTEELCHRTAHLKNCPGQEERYLKKVVDGGRRAGEDGR